MKKLITLLIILTVLLTGCVKPFKYEAFQGENIPTSIIEPVYEVMNDVLNSLKSGDTKVFKKHSHMTSKSEEALQNIEALYKQFQTNYKDLDFSVLDEYFSPSEVDTVTLPFILDDYTMTVAVDGHENYLLLYSGTHNSKELVITSFMIKVEDQWKILHFYIGGYKAAGMKGTEWA